MEEHTVLGDDGDGVTQAVQGHITDVLVAHKDPAIPRVVEPVQEPYYRGFAVWGRQCVVSNAASRTTVTHPRLSEVKPFLFFGSI